MRWLGRGEMQGQEGDAEEGQKNHVPLFCVLTVPALLRPALSWPWPPGTPKVNHLPSCAFSRTGEMKVDLDSGSCLWTPTAPQMPSSTLLSLPRFVPVDIPGTVLEWVCWHLPNIYLTDCEYD